MSGGLRYRTDLYRGTAEDYERFRPAYPPALLDELRARVPISGSGRLLDLACGTGQLAFALASDFARIVAVDQETELVELARRKAQRLGLDHVEWVAAAAERVELEGVFELVAIGNAFHRLDRERVARRLVPRLQPGGCVALLWSDSPWAGSRPWQRELARTLERWRDALGARDRVPDGWRRAVERDPHADVLERAGLACEGRFACSVPTEWSLEALIGFVYSTSFLNRSVLDVRAPEFEHDLRERLGTGEDALRQDVSFACELFRLA